MTEQAYAVSFDNYGEEIMFPFLSRQEAEVFQEAVIDYFFNEEGYDDYDDDYVEGEQREEVAHDRNIVVSTASSTKILTEVINSGFNLDEAPWELRDIYNETKIPA